MAYSNFTLESVVTGFQLEKIESAGIFSEIEPVTPSAELIGDIEKKNSVSRRYRDRKGSL